MQPSEVPEKSLLMDGVVEPPRARAGPGSGRSHRRGKSRGGSSRPGDTEQCEIKMRS